MSEQVLPFYLVCDESYSMAGQALQEINDQIPHIFQEIASNPTVADKARLCIIGFSGTAEVLLPLADLNTAYRRLTAKDFGPHPTILAFGFGTDIKPDTLQAVATFRAFIADRELQPSNALREFAKQLLNSVVASAVASSAAFSANPGAGAQMVFPDQVKGYTVLEADPV